MFFINFETIKLIVGLTFRNPRLIFKWLKKLDYQNIHENCI